MSRMTALNWWTAEGLVEPVVSEPVEAVANGVRLGVADANVAEQPSSACDKEGASNDADRAAP